MKSLLNLQSGIKSKVMSLISNWIAKDSVGRDFAGHQARKSFMRCRITINNRLSPLLLMIMLVSSIFPLAAFAEGPKLVAPKTSVKVGETFNIRVENSPSDADVTWNWDSIAECTTQKATLSCSVQSPAEVGITARIETLQWSDQVIVVIDRAGHQPKPKKQEPQTQDLETAKFQKIERILNRISENPSHGALIEVFKDLGSEGYAVKDLIAFKEKYTRGLDPERGKAKWDNAYGAIERKLMAARRDEVKKARERVFKQFFSENPHANMILMMDIGGWVTESPEKMRFEGDIDFTYLSMTGGYAITLTAMFNAVMNEVFHMDMVRIDALSTAHRFATHHVYVGKGADWAEIDAKRGKISIVVRTETGFTIRDANNTEKVLHFAILKNNIEKKLTGQDKLYEIVADKADPQPTYDMEPSISLEFLRHLCRS